jgi:peptidoglycan/LPS O-acetylase OafA/YrhL
MFSFRHFPELDGLRGLAILLVIAGHVLNFGFGVATDLGGLGVLLFFVLSGFLITGLLDREKLQSGRVSLSRFYIRRGLRLFPALFVFLAALCLLVRSCLVTDTPWYAVAACLLYVRNIWGYGMSSAHIWSLSLEEQFYACWPWVMSVLDRTAALRIGAFATVSITGFRMVAILLKWSDYQSGAFYERPWFRIDSILLGCLLALLLCRPTVAGLFRAYFSSPIVSLALWSSALAWSVWGESLTHVWYLTVQMAFVFLILVNLLLSKKSAYLSALSHPVAAWVGRVSYSWYLWQQLFTAVAYPRWGGLRSFPLNIAASLGLAVASQRFIERPFLQLKERFAHGDGIKSGSVACR